MSAEPDTSPIEGINRDMQAMAERLDRGATLDLVFGAGSPDELDAAAFRAMACLPNFPTMR